ncbi:hypothetical protein ACR777_20405 [Sphingobacterium spiritivorum]
MIAESCFSFEKAYAKGFISFTKWVDDILAGAKNGKNIYDVSSDL